MRPITETILPLIRVGGETLIGRWLTIFEAGYHEFVINTWYLEERL